jgi:hypothetical protein
MYTSIVVELRKTNKVKRHFSHLNLTDAEWEGARILWFSLKLFSPTEVEQIQKSKDWDLVSTKRGRPTFLKVKPGHTISITRDDKIEAHLAREAEIIRLSRNRTGLLVYNKVERNHCVYAFALQGEVTKDKKFREANSKLGLRPKTLVYIGMTSKSREERHHEHCYPPTDGSDDKGSRIMRRFGLRDFNKANLTQVLLKDPEMLVDNLSLGDALWTEQYYGERLKSAQCGTWYN